MATLTLGSLGSIQLGCDVSGYTDGSIKASNYLGALCESNRFFTFRRGTAIYRFDYECVFKFGSKRSRRVIGRNVRKILRNPSEVAILKPTHEIAEAALGKVLASYLPRSVVKSLEQINTELEENGLPIIEPICGYCETYPCMHLQGCSGHWDSED